MHTVMILMRPQNDATQLCFKTREKALAVADGILKAMQKPASITDPVDPVVDVTDDFGTVFKCLVRDVLLPVVHDRERYREGAIWLAMEQQRIAADAGARLVAERSEPKPKKPQLIGTVNQADRVKFG